MTNMHAAAAMQIVTMATNVLMFSVRSDLYKSYPLVVGTDFNEI
jgi:hypothetical protein